MDELNIDTPLKDVLERLPDAAAMLMQLGVNPELHRHETLGQIGCEHGLDPVAMLEVMLAWDSAEPNHVDQEWTDAPLPQLLDHIVATHHEYLRRQLPRVALLLAKTVHDHGREQPNLDKVIDVFLHLRHLLERHMIVQEVVVFPRMRELAQAMDRHTSCEGGVSRAVEEMRHEFELIGEDFNKLRILTHHFQAPPASSTAYQSAVAELANLDRESQRHTHVEDFALFAHALEMEHQATRR